MIALIIIAVLWAFVVGLDVVRVFRERPPFEKWNREVRIATGRELPIWFWWTMTILGRLGMAAWYAPARRFRSARDVVRVHFLAWRFKRQLQRRYPGAKITSRVQVVDGSNEPKFTITVLPK